MTFDGRWCREFHPRRRPFATARRRREPPRAHVARDARRCSGPARRASASSGARCGAPTWRGAATAECTPSGCPTAAPCCSSASCCSPARWCWRPASSYTTPRVYAVHSPAGARTRPAASSTPSCARRQPHRGAPRPVVLNTWEAVYFDHDFDTLVAPRRAGGGGRRRAVRARRRLVRRPPRRHGRARRLVGVTRRPPRRSGAADRAGPRARHGVRHLGRAGDGQPRQRPLPRPSRVGARRRPATSRCSAATSSCSTSPAPTPSTRSSVALDALLGDHDIAFVKWDMNRDHVQASGADGRAGTHAQTLALYRAARRAAPAPPRRRDRELLVGRGAHRPRHPRSAPSGCGRATATTPSSARRSSATPRR